MYCSIRGRVADARVGALSELGRKSRPTNKEKARKRVSD